MSSLSAWTFGAFSSLLGVLPPDLKMSASFIGGDSENWRVSELRNADQVTRCWAAAARIQGLGTVLVKSSPNSFIKEDLVSLARSKKRADRGLAGDFLRQSTYLTEHEVPEQISTLTVESDLSVEYLLNWCKCSLASPVGFRILGVVMQSSLALDVTAMLAPNPWQFPRLRGGWPLVNGDAIYFMSCCDAKSCISDDWAGGVCYLRKDDAVRAGELIEVKIFPDIRVANRLFHGKYR